MKYLYLLINTLSVVVPLAFSFHPRLLFYKKWAFAFPAIAISALLFIAWDIYFTHIGVWGFSDRFTMGARILNLPFEEVLFFICIPYSCLFTYYAISLLKSKKDRGSFWKIVTPVLIFLLITLTIVFYNKLYTSFTFAGLAVTLFVLKFVFKVQWLNRFYFAFLILLIPFSIVNGILTGTGLKEPVVWYNNFENMGVRIGTIPVEDIFYGMLLILLNVGLFEFFKQHHAS